MMLNISKSKLAVLESAINCQYVYNKSMATVYCIHSLYSLCRNNWHDVGVVWQSIFWCHNQDWGASTRRGGSSRAEEHVHRKRRKAKRRKEGKKQQNSQKTTVKESERSKRESNRILEEHRKEIEAETTELPKTRSDQDWGTEEEGDAIGA